MVRIILLNLAAFLLLAASVMAAEVEATLDRDSVPAGDGALLTLRISGGNAGQPEIPVWRTSSCNPAAGASKSRS